MNIAIWDTYVKRKDGRLMHFDILVPSTVQDTSIVYEYGKKYLKTKGQEGQELSSHQCRFCHIQSMKPQWENDIREQGYHIIEMENCN